MAEPLELHTDRDGVVLRQLWPDGDNLRMGVWDNDTFVAFVASEPRPDGSNEIGYFTESQHQGHGYASLGAATLVRHVSQRYQRIVTVVGEDNPASIRVSEKAGLHEVARSAGKLTLELISERQSPFPHIYGTEHIQRTGGYKLAEGSETPVEISPGGIAILKNGQRFSPDPLPGVYDRGVYTGSGRGAGKRIVSFLYHKLDEYGQLETDERVILLQGIGYGVHPGHTGQPPTWYLVGAKLGTLDHETGKVISMVKEDTRITPNHFSIACITDGPFGVPLLANPDKLPREKAAGPLIDYPGK